jgi:acetate---CoA ligase (ADP-forming)
MPHLLEDLLHPKGVAIIGQVNRALTEAQLRAQHDPRYGASNWSLVNPKGGAIGALPIYSSVRDVPGQLDLAVITAPAEACAQVLRECGERGVRFAVVFSSGFSETGPEGAALERELAAAAREAGVRVLGPNTNNNLLERIPDPPAWRGGRIGVVTQSGHNGRPIVQGTALGIAFRRQVPCGNECDLEISDFIDYFACDPETAVIAGYIEGFRNGAKLRRALAAANAAHKPVVLLKIGSTRGGARMAHSHTGHLAGADAVVDGLFAQHAVTRVRDLDEVLDTAALFARLPAGTGARVALYSISGGSGTLMAECAELAGVSVPRLAPHTVAQLREYLPGFLTVENPVDNGATFIISNPPEVRQKLIDLILDDPNIDLLVVGVTGALAPMTDELARDLEALAERGTAKPILVTWNSPKVDDPGYASIVRSGWPMFRSFRNCFAAIRHWQVYQERLRGWRERRAPRKRLAAPAQRAIEGARGVLSPIASGALLRAAGLPLVAESLATTPAEAARAARALRFPVALKVASPDFPHKSDAGLVALGLASASEVKRAAQTLLRRARRADRDARIDGVLVQRMAGAGVELLVGVTRDPVLGPAVTVGLGGIFTEVLADVAVRPVPLDRRDAREMLASLRGAPLLRGVRGRPGVDLRALERLIVQVAELASALGDRLAELDLNPVIATPEGVAIVDHLVVLA